MKKFYILFIFTLLLNCSSKKKIDTDIKELKKEGKVIYQNLDKESLDFAVINNIKLNKIDLSSSMLSSSNMTKHLNLNLNLVSLQKKQYLNDNLNSFFRKNIIISKNKILFVDGDGILFILDENLQLLNKINLYKTRPYKNYLLKFSLVTNNNVLYISDNLGSIFAVDLNKYSILWNKNLDVPFLSNLAINEDSVFVTNSNGKLFSFKLLDGVQNWSFETGTKSVKTEQAFKILIYKNFLFFSNDLGSLYCIDLTNKKIVWDYNIPNSALNVNNQLLKLSNFVIEKDFLYFSSTMGKIIKIDINNSRTIWTSDVASDVTPIINPETILTIDESGIFYVFEKENGKIIFKKNIIKLLKENNYKTEFTKFNNIFLDSGKIYLTSVDGFFISINASNLNEIKFYKLLNEINSVMEILNNHIFLIGNLNYIYKIK